MAEFVVLLSRSSEKNLGRIDAKIRRKIMLAIDELEANPAPAKKYDLTKISGSESNYRIRIGRYRILYSINWAEKQVKVYDIDRRSDSTYK